MGKILMNQQANGTQLNNIFKLVSTLPRAINYFALKGIYIK